MISRRTFLTASAGAAVTASWAAGSSTPTTDVRVLTATDVHVKDYPTVEAVRWIGETLERETGGRLKIRLYHAGQLGRESEAIDMARKKSQQRPVRICLDGIMQRQGVRHRGSETGDSCGRPEGATATSRRRRA